MHELFNHLWQSTLFALGIAGAAVLLRRNSPRLRYWLWLAASVKFLVPFSLLVSTGARIQLPPDTPSLHAVTVQQISSYFAPVSVVPTAGPAAATFRLPRTLGAIWLAGTLLLLVRWFRRWRSLHLAARQATRLPTQHALPAVSSPAMVEPGVFGLFRPVLLLPEGITDNLTPEQFDAILNHELRHVRYRDNLTAALHMCVETLFWFHPIVWWIGARLMDERERDCDEAVLRQGSQPADYARGIVQVCEAYIESPLACASGISGSDLKKRIREIMTWRGSLPVTPRGKAMLAAASLAVVSVPLVIGILRAQTLPPAPAYTYDVVSIHRSDPAERNIHISDGPQGGIRTTNTSVLRLISAAWKVEEYRIMGAPRWADAEHFDVTFTPDKAEPTPATGALPEEWEGFFSHNMQRLQAVLRDRFGLVLRAETRELPIYLLTQAKGGIRVARHPDGKPADGKPGASTQASIATNGDRQIKGTNASMEMLAAQLAWQLQRPVHDETHIVGRYDFTLDWIPDKDLPEGPILSAINDELGLRLEPAKGPVQVYVVEKVDRPTEN